MCKPAAYEAFPEPALITGRIAKDAPDDLCVLVSECALRDLPNYIRDRRALVEDDKNALTVVVESSECLGVTLRPGHHVNAPCTLMERITREQGSGGHCKVFASDKHAMPLRYLGPG